MKMRPTRVKVTRTNSLHKHIETTQTYVGRPQPLPLSTGSEIEAEEDVKVSKIRYQGKVIKPVGTKCMPIFLKAVPKLEATMISLPPLQDDRRHRIVDLLPQPVNLKT